VRVKAHRVTADDALHRVSTCPQPTRIERFGDGGDMLVKAAPGDEHGERQGSITPPSRRLQQSRSIATPNMAAAPTRKTTVMMPRWRREISP
jgi:hypothetical protein